MRKFLFLILVGLFTISVSYAGMSEKECNEYVQHIEKCIKERKGEDLDKKWRHCEGVELWSLLVEYKNNGFCFDDDECKEKILKDVESCNKQRDALYRKLLQEK
ncbi:hypothetical protein [Persephonella sp.]